ncbi:MAG TPA: hypothetical protein VFQ51_15970, partial [Vicinamibacteria bacterium]|nr:hypothetical protein [Vicinamibacteria bacterium]
MKSLRVPGWLASGMLERYHAGASHLFLLHGNVRDVHPFGEEYVPLASGLATLFAQRPHVVSYDVSSGLAFPDQAREKALKKVLGIKQPLPADPGRALIVLDALLNSDKCPPGSIAIVLEFAHAIAPAGGSGGVERQNITQLARWASDERLAARRPLIVLIAPNAVDVSDEVYSGASGAEVVLAPRPDMAIRADFAESLKDRYSEVAWEMTPADLAAETGGLSLVQMEDVVQRARSARAPLARPAILERKIELLRQEYS